MQLQRIGVIVLAMRISVCGFHLSFLKADADPKILVEDFKWKADGVLCAASGISGSRETICRSATTGWGWGGYNANSGGQVSILAANNQVRFQRGVAYCANITGSYVYTVFSSAGNNRANQQIDLSGIGATFKIRARSVAEQQAIRWMIRNQRGEWFISSEPTWGQTLPVSVSDDHFRSYPIAMYEWVQVINDNLNRLDNGGERPLQFGGKTVSPGLDTITGAGIYIERSAETGPFVFDGFALSEYEPIIYAPPNMATHWFTGPGNLRVGAGCFSGGVFNEMYWGTNSVNMIPGMNGRAVNFAFRSQYHSGVWNPIQSGFWEEFGRPVVITAATNNGYVSYSWGPVPMSLWHGDGNFDFCQYEDLTFGNPYRFLPAHTDTDTLPEPGLSQADEVISDFDMSGFYEDVSYVNTNTLVLRVVHEADFCRLGNNTFQFNSNAVLITGESILDESRFLTDISDVLPGEQSSTETDMTNVPVIWSDRLDRQYANMKWFWAWDADRKAWDITELDVLQESHSTQSSLTVLADGGKRSDSKSCRGVGLYYPEWAERNQYPIVGIESSSGNIVYQEARLQSPVDQYASWRVNNTNMLGENNDITANYVMRSLRVRLKGLLSPDHTLQGCHERLRKENFWIFGTPDEIKKAVMEIDKQLKVLAEVFPGQAHITAMPGETVIQDGAVNADLPAVLCWWPGVRAESSDVYFGADSNLVANAQRNSIAHRTNITAQAASGEFCSGAYNCTGLQPKKTYFWRVDSVNASGITKGPVWTFSTKQNSN